jgi:hypothetical protein
MSDTVCARVQGAARHQDKLSSQAARLDQRLQVAKRALDAAVARRALLGVLRSRLCVPLAAACLIRVGCPSVLAPSVLAQELRAAVKEQERTLVEQQEELLAQAHAVAALQKHFANRM